MSVRLIGPNPALEASHASLVEEMQASDEELVPWVLAEKRATFAAYVTWLELSARGIDLPRGFVAHSTYWLVDAKQEILGVSNLRHHLTPTLTELGGHIGYGVRPSARRQGYATEMLRLSLIEARRIGIGPVRVTCARDNLASAKTILRNGGELDDERYLESVGHVVQRYWIRS